MFSESEDFKVRIAAQIYHNVVTVVAGVLEFGLIQSRNNRGWEQLI
jgi:hypothetical protein